MHSHTKVRSAEDASCGRKTGHCRLAPVATLAPARCHWPNDLSSSKFNSGDKQRRCDLHCVHATARAAQTSPRRRCHSPGYRHQVLRAKFPTELSAWRTRASPFVRPFSNLRAVPKLLDSSVRVAMLADALGPNTRRAYPCRLGASRSARRVTSRSRIGTKLRHCMTHAPPERQSPMH